MWVRLGFDYPVDFVSRLVMNIGGPCLVLSSLTTMKIDLAEMGNIVWIALLVMLIMGISGWVVTRLYSLDIRSYLPPLLFPNVGNAGLSVCLFAFGKEGLALALVYFLVIVFLQLTIGIFIFSSGMGSLAERLKDFIRQPFLWAMLLGILFLKIDYTTPKWFDNTVGLLGELTIPLMLITLGVSLASLKISAWRRSLGFSCIRVFGGLASAWCLCEFLDVTGLSRGVVLLQASMPVAVFNYLFAHRYNRNPGDVAGMVVVSTLLAFAMLPFLISYLIQYP